MKMTQFEICFAIAALTIFMGCNPSKLSSHYSLGTPSQIAKAAPEKEAINVEQKIELYNQALQAMNKNTSSLSLERAAKTNWNYLGYQLRFSTTDGRGNVMNRLSRANTKINFSDLQIDSCPAGLYCIMVYQPYVTINLLSECQKAAYRMQENRINGSSMAPQSQFLWTVVSGEKTPNCTGTDEDDFFLELSREMTRNDLLMFVSDQFLYIQSNGLTFIFSK